jgi:hypothetical protein
MRRVLALLLLPGCFYTDRVNTRPHAKFVISPASAVIGTTLTLDATNSSDDEGDPLTYAWTINDCSTPSDCVLAPGGTSTQRSFTFPIPNHDLLAVQLTVTDSSGASDTTSQTISPDDRPPTLMAVAQGTVNLDGTYTLGRKLSVQAIGSDPDGDSPTYTFELTPPAASDPDVVVFTSTSPTSYKLIPDVAGHWEVKVTADDGHGMQAVDRATFDVVADQPPVIAATTPDWAAGRTILLTTDGPRAFSIDLVLDDLDPYPLPFGTLDQELGTAHFRWYVDGTELADHDLASLTLDPAAYAPGDVVEVRAEVYDRVARVWPCDTTAAVCPQVDPRRVTWEVEIR